MHVLLLLVLKRNAQQINLSREPADRFEHATAFASIICVTFCCVDIYSHLLLYSGETSSLIVQLSIIF